MWGLNDILTYSIAYGMGEEEEKAKAEREKKASSNWHTGIPTDEGWYLIAFLGSNKRIEYASAVWCYNEWDAHCRVIAWQKITPYEGEEQFPCGCCKCYEDKKCILLDAEVGARTRDERCPLRKEKK